jgi:hypothetical protein
MKLFVMLITVSIQNPATISGFDSLAACRAAEPAVIAFYKRTMRSTAIAIECVELPKSVG